MSKSRNRYYTREIVKYGILSPLATIGLIVGIGMLGIGKFSEEKEARNTRYNRMVTAEDAIKSKLEPNLRKNRAEYNYLVEVSGENAPTLMRRIVENTIANLLPPQTIILKSLKNEGPAGEIIKGVSVTRMSADFVGRFATMQAVIIDMEMRLAPLFLTSLRMTRVRPNESMGISQEHIDVTADYLLIGQGDEK